MAKLIKLRDLTQQEIEFLLGHPKDAACLYVALGEDRTAIVQITIQEEPLPAPLEIPRRRPPYIHELSPILRQIAHHQYTTTPPL